MLDGTTGVVSGETVAVVLGCGPLALGIEDGAAGVVSGESVLATPGWGVTSRVFEAIGAVVGLGKGDGARVWS